MKQIVRAMGLCVVLIAVAPVALAQDRPGAVATEAVESVVTVRAVNYETRMVTVERPDGKLATIQVPPEAHNLYQVQPGNKFRVRYLESVAIDVLDPGTEANTGAVPNRGTRTQEGCNAGRSDRERQASCGQSRGGRLCKPHRCRQWSPGQARVQGGSGGETPQRGGRTRAISYACAILKPSRWRWCSRRATQEPTYHNQ